MIRTPGQQTKWVEGERGPTISTVNLPHNDNLFKKASSRVGFLSCRNEGVRRVLYWEKPALGLLGKAETATRGFISLEERVKGRAGR